MADIKIEGDVLEDLKKHAKKNNFHIINHYDKYFSFHPGAGEGFRRENSYGSRHWSLDDDSYITVDNNLSLDNHKFLEKKEYLHKKVSLEWIKGFLRYRSNDAAKDAENKRKEAKKRTERNKSIIEANEMMLPEEIPIEEMPDALRMPRNTPVNGVAGGLKIKTSDENDNAGPTSDDWMSEDWEDHLGGPNW